MNKATVKQRIVDFCLQNYERKILEYRDYISVDRLKLSCSVNYVMKSGSRESDELTTLTVFEYSVEVAICIV